MCRAVTGPSHGGETTILLATMMSPEPDASPYGLAASRGSTGDGGARRAQRVKNGEEAIRDAAALRWCRAGARLTRLPDHPGDRAPVQQLFAQVRPRLAALSR